MPPRSPYLDQNVSEALNQQEKELRPFWRNYARPVEIHFPAANDPRQVAHGLGVVPSGYLVVMQTGALYSLTPERWTSDLALLTAPVANTRAMLIFFTLREEPVRV